MSVALYDQRRRYYVYALTDPRKPGPFAWGRHIFQSEPFYIGKGTGYRTGVHITEARRVVKEGIEYELDPIEDAKLFRIIEIFNKGLEPEQLKLVEGLNEFESLELEADLIRAIGRESKKRGPLVNENDGYQFEGPLPIKTEPLQGMNNVIGSEGPLPVPRVILNADVDPLGNAQQRVGKKLRIPLPGAHSMWRGNYAWLIAAKNVLYRVRNMALETICSFDGPPEAPLFYSEYGGLVYISNEFWNGVLDLEDNSVAPWGCGVPDAPLVMAGAGSLLPGTYRLCMANSCGPGGRLYGGAGPWTEVELFEEGGFIILNRVPGQRVFCTDVHGDIFYLIGAIDTVTHISSADPLYSLHCAPPLRLKFIQQYAGRMWGSDGGRLFYSQPHRFDLFNINDHFNFEREIWLIAPVEMASAAGGPLVGGIFIGFEDQTIFLTGSDPQAMVERMVGDGVVRNALAYADSIPEVGNRVPVWLTQKGVMAGSPHGDLHNLTVERLKFNPGDVGAAFYTQVRGYPQFMATYKRGTDGSYAGFGDSATCEIVRRGTIIQEEEN